MSDEPKNDIPESDETEAESGEKQGELFPESKPEAPPEKPAKAAEDTAKAAKPKADGDKKPAEKKPAAKKPAKKDDKPGKLPADDDPWLKKVREAVGEDAITEAYRFAGELTFSVKGPSIVEVCKYLRDEPEFSFDFLSDLCGADYPDQEERFVIFYNLYSVQKKHRIRLRASVAEGAEIPSVVEVWSTADWMEREAYDMYGVKFGGHPDLRRILMPDDWDGYPLRKDYPLEGLPSTLHYGED